jgi:curli biogenesis system outer membrane secretion channel CsgG
MKYLKTLVFMIFVAISVQSWAEKPTAAVVEFVNNSGAAWWTGGMGWELSGMLTNELAGTKKFAMLERSAVEAVLVEQDLAASGRISADSGAKIGEMVGAKYLILGTVTSYEHDTADTGGGMSFKGISIGGSKDKAYIAIDLRVVDSTTGVIVDTRTVEASSSGGGMRLGLSKGGFSGGFSDMKKTPAGKAIRAVMMEAADYLACSLVKKGRCMNAFDKKEASRREKTKGAVELE